MWPWNKVKPDRWLEGWCKGMNDGVEAMRDYEPKRPENRIVETLTAGDPTTGRPMTSEDGYAGRLVVDLRNLVNELRAYITGMER